MTRIVTTTYRYKLPPRKRKTTTPSAELQARKRRRIGRPPFWTAKRIAKLFRSLSSDFDGEILTAVAAMKRLFAAEGLSFHDIATVIESCNGEIEERKPTRFALSWNIGRRSCICSNCRIRSELKYAMLNLRFCRIDPWSRQPGKRVIWRYRLLTLNRRRRHWVPPPGVT